MEKLQVSFVMEILGKPKEYIAESLKNHVEKLKNERGVSIKEYRMHEPVLVKDSKEIYTTFCEVNADLDSLSNYFLIIFNYFPSNIEIISPEKFKVDSHYLNEMGAALVQRLHEYDSLAKKLVADKNILTRMLQEHAPQLFKNNNQNKEIQQGNEEPTSEQKSEPKETLSKEKKPKKSRKISKE